MPDTYRRRPQTVKAVQVGPNTVAEIRHWLNATVDLVPLPGPARGIVSGARFRFVHDGDLVNLHVPYGDWVVQDGDHRPRPMVGSVFEADYERYEDPVPVDNDRWGQ